MYDHDALTIRQIGGPTTYQTLLYGGSDLIWTSPLFLDRSSAQVTAQYLHHEIKMAQCSECWANPYVLADVLSEATTTEPELVFLCRLCYSEALAEDSALEGVDL